MRRAGLLGRKKRNSEQRCWGNGNPRTGFVGNKIIAIFDQKFLCFVDANYFRIKFNNNLIKTFFVDI